jgi:hypothetical protein
MTVETVAVAPQQIERTTGATIRHRRSTRGQQVAFVAVLGVAEVAWVTLLVALVHSFL